MSLAFARLEHRDNFRIIDQFCGILAEDCELRHLYLERGHHVVFILDVPLSIASGAWVYRLAVVNIIEWGGYGYGLELLAVVVIVEALGLARREIGRPA